MTDSRKELGQKGEKAAQIFLTERGYEILETNWRCSYGEVDIIARDGDELIFCEVKTRRTTSAGIPEEAVTPQKRQRYIKMARLYLNRNQVAHSSIRFDVIGIYALNDSQALLRYARNAFDASGD